jgi:hypothetical protein
MDENPPEVFVVFFETMIQLFDVTLIQEAQHLFLELSAALAGNDFDQLDFAVDGFLHDTVEFRIDLVATIVDVM